MSHDVPAEDVPPSQSTHDALAESERLGDLVDAPAVPTPPETGDLVVDAALRELAANSGDLDAQLEAAESVHRTLHTRLADLGG